MKKLWKNNRVVFVLVIILIICFIAICSVALTFFYSKDTNEYGNRLDGIEKHQISSEFKSSYKEKFLESENVKSVDFNIKGRMNTTEQATLEDIEKSFDKKVAVACRDFIDRYNLEIKFDENITLDNAKKLVENSMSLFDEDTLSYYDVQFIIQSDNFTIMASKNSAAENISWNNNTPIEEDTDEEK